MSPDSRQLRARSTDHDGAVAEAADDGTRERENDSPTVGRRLRAIRGHRRLPLKAVADQAGISESFLSQIERDRSNASIATLQAIASALGVSMAMLFEEQLAVPEVLRRGYGPAVSFGLLGRKYLLTPAFAASLEVVLGELEPGGSTGSEAYHHGDSEELCMVLSGRVEVQVGSATYEMDTGDSIFYRSSADHRTTNIGGGPATVLWVISPPSY